MPTYLFSSFFHWFDRKVRMYIRGVYRCISSASFLFINTYSSTYENDDVIRANVWRYSTNKKWAWLSNKKERYMRLIIIQWVMVQTFWCFFHPVQLKNFCIEGDIAICNTKIFSYLNKLCYMDMTSWLSTHQHTY